MTDLGTLQAPIVDLFIVHSGDQVPEGYYKLQKTLCNKKANLNSGSSGHHLYLCIKKDLTYTLPAVTNLVVIFPEKGDILLVT